MFTMWATARPGVEPADLEAAMVAEVDRLTADGPAEAELERVRNLHAAAVESSLERVAERADRLSMYTCLFDEPERITTEVSRYLAVGPDRIRQALAEVLRADNRLSLTFLPGEPGVAAPAAAEEVAS
jgi:zinc protease